MKALFHMKNNAAVFIVIIAVGLQMGLMLNKVLIQMAILEQV
jgi:hypothetical protein